MLEKEPFVKYDVEIKESKDIFTIRLNTDERNILNDDKKILRQLKDSTAIKQLALIGHYVIHEQKTAYILDVILGNKRRNERIGIDEIATN